MKRAYYYFFYKLYRFWENVSDPKFWSDWKATVTIIVLELLILLSIGAYYAVISRTILDLNIKMPIVYIPSIIIMTTNYFAFIHTDKWKDYVEEFDLLPQKNNKTGSWIVFIIILLIIMNWVFSIYLMSQVDWSQYR